MPQRRFDVYSVFSKFECELKGRVNEEQGSDADGRRIGETEQSVSFHLYKHSPPSPRLAILILHLNHLNNNTMSISLSPSQQEISRLKLEVSSLQQQAHGRNFGQPIYVGNYLLARLEQLGVTVRSGNTTPLYF